MKVFKFTTRWIFVLCLPFMLLTGNLGAAVNSLALYKYGFHKYDITQVTGIDEAQLEKAARGLISYFNSGEEFINVVVEKDGEPFTLFNQREVIHLKDVKALFWLDYKVFFATLIYVLSSAGFYLRRRENWRYLAKSVAIGSVLTLGVMAALWIVSRVDFEGFFIQFHMLAFSNDFWQLNPYTDYLLMMFPEGFWNDAVLFIALGATLMSVILLGLSLGHLRFNKRDAARDKSYSSSAV